VGSRKVACSLRRNMQCNYPVLELRKRFRYLTSTRRRRQLFAYRRENFVAVLPNQYSQETPRFCVRDLHDRGMLVAGRNQTAAKHERCITISCGFSSQHLVFPVARQGLVFSFSWSGRSRRMSGDVVGVRAAVLSCFGIVDTDPAERMH